MSQGEGLVTLAYGVANGATWDDSPAIMDTWVPFPKVSLPVIPPVFTLQVTPLQKLTGPTSYLNSRSTGESHILEVDLLFFCIETLSLVCSVVLLLPHLVTVPWVGGCDFNKPRLHRVETPVQGGSI